MRWSKERLLEYQARNNKLVSDNKPDDGLECELDRKIIKYCEDHGFYYFHDRSRGINKKGFLDFVIALPKGRTVYIENKSKTGRFSPEQKLNIVKLTGLGHEVYECRSYKKFLEIILIELKDNA